ncbi:MAG: Lrp/AsnC ligand binding domain-containing protein [Candidatus Thorarchaeota archaeon]|nr:Lrp/AsnC ligand binding domain-containing protein [Candidatus Thorarchaeota archaeon]
MTIKVFLTINVVSGRARDIRDKIKSFQEVRLVCTIDHGTFDVVAFVEIESLEDYRTFSIDKVGKLPYIEDYTSFITLDG